MKKNPKISDTPSSLLGRSSNYFGSWLHQAVFLGGVFIIFSIFYPVSAGASILSLVTSLWAAETPKAENTANSQTIALLEAVTGDNLPTTPLTETDMVVSDDTAIVAEAGPTGSLADIATSTRQFSDQISTYVVRPGDSLGQIAQMFGVSINTIRWANDLSAGKSITPGQKLVILPISGVQYVVKKGDTLASVAKRFGGDTEEILSFNDLVDGKLTVGETIIVPDGEAYTPPPQKKVLVTKNGKKQVSYVDARPSYAGYYKWPVAGGRKSQGLHGHNGIDIAAPSGTPILAAAAGTVIIARDGGWNGGYGSYIVIKHSNGTQTLYSHASAVNVSEGQSVGQGQTIGAIGSTGKSTGNHLHFEVRGAKNPF